MGQLSVHRAGLTLAALMAAFHVIWVGLVASGHADSVLAFVYRIHFVDDGNVAITPFRPAAAVLLVLVTGLTGYLIGAVWALTWNCLGWWTGVGESSTALGSQDVTAEPGRTRPPKAA